MEHSNFHKAGYTQLSYTTKRSLQFTKQSVKLVEWYLKFFWLFRAQACFYFPVVPEFPVSLVVLVKSKQLLQIQKKVCDLCKFTWQAANQTQTNRKSNYPM